MASFNPRARVGRDRINFSNPVGTLSSFNPRARVGRDKAHKAATTKEEVSIHAPAWGATRSVCGNR